MKKINSPNKKTPFFSLRLLQNWSFTQVNSQFISFTSLKKEAFFIRDMVFGQALNIFGALLLFISLLSCEKDKSSPNWENCGYHTDAGLKTLYFVDEKYGFVGGGDDSYQEYSSSLLIKTEDGGKTWKYIDFVSENRIRKIYFLNKEVGFVQTKEHVYKTSNGGTNWSKIDFGADIESDRIKDFSFADGELGYVICSEETDYSIWYDKVIRTTDGGKTWEVFLESSNNYTLPNIYFIQALEKSQIVYISTTNSIYKSSDRAGTWKKIYYNMNGTIPQFHFLDEQTGCVAHTDSLYMTTGDGESFKSIASLEDLKGVSKPILTSKTEGVLAVWNTYQFNIETKKFTSYNIPNDHEILDMVMVSPTSGFALSHDNIFRFKGN